MALTLIHVYVKIRKNHGLKHLILAGENDSAFLISCRHTVKINRIWLTFGLSKIGHANLPMQAACMYMCT